MLRILLACLIFGSSLSLKAQLFPALGGQRVGISALSFLKIDVSPRSAGLGGASLCSSGDVYSTAINPGALTEIAHPSFGLSNTFWANEVNYAFLSAVIPTKTGTWSGSISSLNSGAMPVRTVFQPNGTGEYFYANFLTAGLTYSRQLTDAFSFGVTGRFVHEQMAEFQASTGVIDLGFLYRTDFRDLRFAVMVQNFGPNSTLKGDLKVDTTFQSQSPTLDGYPAPTVFLLGMSMALWKNDAGNQSLTGLLQLNHPNDNAENIRLGLEYNYKELLFLRVGYKLNVEDERLPAFGFGVRTRVGSHPLRIDYAADPVQYLGMIHRVGMGFYLNPVGQ